MVRTKTRIKIEVTRFYLKLGTYHGIWVTTNECNNTETIEVKNKRQNPLCRGTYQTRIKIEVTRFYLKLVRTMAFDLDHRKSLLGELPHKVPCRKVRLSKSF